MKIQLHPQIHDSCVATFPTNLCVLAEKTETPSPASDCGISFLRVYHFNKPMVIIDAGKIVKVPLIKELCVLN